MPSKYEQMPPASFEASMCQVALLVAAAAVVARSERSVERMEGTQADRAHVLCALKKKMQSNFKKGFWMK